MRRGALFFALITSALAQPPLIYNRSVFNAATFMPAGLPGGAIARGSIFSLFGERIGPAAPAAANAYPLGATISGVSINVVQGSTTVAAIPLFVSSNQVNAIMPSNAPLGAASIQISVGNFRSNMAPVRIVSSAFGIFTALQTGLGPGILQNFITAGNQPINSPTVTAQNGQVIILWGTGLGPVTGGDNVAPPVGNLPAQTEVFVGGVSAPVLYSGRAPGFAGTDQINFRVPDNAPKGCWVPVYVRTGGTNVSNFVTMAIQNSGAACSTDVLPQMSSVFVKGGSAGAAGVLRTTTRHDIGVRTPVDVTSDYHAWFGTSVQSTLFPFHPVLGFPPAGTCTVYTLQGDMLAGDLLPGLLPNLRQFDFGAPLALSGPTGTRTLNATFNGFNAGFLGGAITNNILPSSLFLEPGSYSLQGFGGMDVGRFSTSFTIPQALNWTNRNQLQTVDRTQPLVISWTGADSGQMVAIIGFGEDLPTNSSAVFACIAPPGASSFAVPRDVLSNLPATRANPLQSKHVIYLLSVPGASLQNVSVTGLDQAIVGYALINGKTVVLQ